VTRNEDHEDGSSRFSVSMSAFAIPRTTRDITLYENMESFQ